MIRKFPCYCNLCEHKSRACAKSNEAPMEKTWLKVDFDMFRKSYVVNCVNTNPEPVLRVKKHIYEENMA